MLWFVYSTRRALSSTLRLLGAPTFLGADHHHIEDRMEQIPRLKSLLLSIANGATAPNLEQDVFNALNASKDQLIRIFDVGARNTAEKKELEAGAWWDHCVLLSVC